MKGGTQRTTQKVEPGEFIRPAVDKLLDLATKSVETPKSFFPSSTVAGFDPLQQEAFDLSANVARGILPSLASGSAEALGSAFRLASDPGSDPIVQGQISAALDPLQERLQNQILPSIRHSAIQAGGFGTERQGLAETEATKQFIRASGDAINNILATARGQGLQSLQLLPTVSQAQLGGANVLGDVGARMQQQEQARINEEVARHQFEQGELDQRTANFAQIISSLLPSASTKTGTQQVTGSPLNTALSAGLLFSPAGPFSGIFSAAAPAAGLAGATGIRSGISAFL